jgi:hypothetical protein
MPLSKMKSFISVGLVKTFFFSVAVVIFIDDLFIFSIACGTHPHVNIKKKCNLLGFLLSTDCVLHFSHFKKGRLH